jgi:starch phosphorylase
VLDGWWCEAYRQDNGWAIGAGEDYDDQEYQDAVESTTLYDLLENEIVPAFYDRSSDDVPREWTKIMKNSMRTVNAEFNTNRMVEDYTERFYIPCLESSHRLGQEGFAKAKELAAWRRRVTDAWPKVRIECVNAAPDPVQTMGTNLPVQATIFLGDIDPQDVLVEVFHGLLDPGGKITAGEAATLFPGERIPGGYMVFTGEIACRRAGLRGFTVRMVPRKDGYPLDRFETGLVTWWDDSGGRICPTTPPTPAAQTQRT